MVVLLGASRAWAQQHDEPVVSAYLLNVSRVEGWRFFRPASEDGDPTYALLGNRVTLGVGVVSRRLDVEGSLQYAQLIGLPKEQSTLAPLGPGPQFYRAAQSFGAYQLYFKTLSLRLHDVIPATAFTVGRMRYESSPATPVAGRLVGNADWTMFERAFDGVRIDVGRGAWHGHASYVMPTQGAFEESANAAITNVRVATLAMRRRAGELFAHHYRDRRTIRGRVDNSGLDASRVDVAIVTLGGSYSRVLAVGPGEVDGVGWFASQVGDWYGQKHRAFSVVAEGGYRWPQVTWQPWLRVGAQHASGDDDSHDDRHRTFFPMLPTSPPSGLAGAFAQMNLRETFAQIRVRPHARVGLMAETRRLALVTAADRWYSGTGATVASGDYFGFSTRASRLATGLGMLCRFSADAALSRRWTVDASLAFMRGSDVIARQFAGRNLTTASIVNRLAWR